MKRPGRRSDKEKNLRRFAKQWAEYEDEAQGLSEYGEEDAHYASGVLHLGEDSMDKYNDLANAVQLEV